MTGRTNVLHLDVPEMVRLDKLARGQLFRFANYEKDIYMITESASAAVYPVSNARIRKHT